MISLFAINRAAHWIDREASLQGLLFDAFVDLELGIEHGLGGAITDEFELAAREYKLTPAQIHELLITAANAAFAEPSVRSQLAKALA